MPQPRSALAALFTLALAFPAFANRPAPRKPTVVPPADCKTLSDSLVKLYDAGDPTYLTWDFAEAACDPSQLYMAYYYQGIGFEFISAWKEALYFLNAAREIGGPKDEEILYHLWTVYSKLERYTEMERLTLELHRRYPNSYFLFEILDQWRSVKSPSLIAWNYSARAGISSTHYLTDQITNRMQGEIRQQSGAHRFREHASASLASKWNASDWDNRLIHGFQANLGGEYAYKGFTADADWGAGYATPTKDTLIRDGGAQPYLLADSNWNFIQGHLGIGYSYTTPRGWNLGATASLFQLNKDWLVAGISHTQSLIFHDFLLLGYFDFQKHWIGTPPAAFYSTDTVTNTPVLTTLGLHDMYAFTASITPYITMERHAFGAGPNYYMSLSHYDRTSKGTAITEKDLAHTLSGMATYDYEPRHWCRFSITGSYGVEFDKGFGATHYRRPRGQPWVYSVDAGASFSF